MQQLKQPDSFHLAAAQGWLELDNHIEANAELEKIASNLRAHPDVLEVRWEIYAKLGTWDACRDIAALLVQLVPDRPQSWINLAYAFRRVQGGSLQAGLEILIDAAVRFPDEATIRYNLACFTASLGDFRAAKAWLAQAFDKGDAKQLRLMAIDDPDLEALWQSEAV